MSGSDICVRLFFFCVCHTVVFDSRKRKEQQYHSKLHAFLFSLVADGDREGKRPEACFDMPVSLRMVFRRYTMPW